MVTGRDLIENGWPEGPTIGLGLGAVEKLRAAGMDENSILRELEKTRAVPDAPMDLALEPLARELVKRRHNFAWSEEVGGKEAPQKPGTEAQEPTSSTPARR